MEIATAAYFRAERRGFEPGHELADWLAAEAEVAATDAQAQLCGDDSTPGYTLQHAPGLDDA